MNDRAKVTPKYAAEKAFLKTHSHPWFPNQHQGPIGSNATSMTTLQTSVAKPGTTYIISNKT